MFRSLRRRLSDALPLRSSQAEAYPTVDVFEWRPSDGTVNFGDHLGTVIVSKILADAGLSPTAEVSRPRRLFSVGSVLHFAETGDTVWGSGRNGKLPDDRHVFETLDVRAVRGPLTAEFLRSRGIPAPDIYGDPALLLPHLFPDRFVRQSSRPILFVPNLHDAEAAESPYPTISPLRGWNLVVEEIVQSDLVIASSLHGLIIAEAYGIPARYLRLSETESLFKYEDYVMGTGRPGLEYATRFEEAVEMGGMPPISFAPEALLRAFPFDLWH